MESGNNLLLAQFFYGLSFLFLGFLILERFRGRDEGPPLLRHLRLLGLFAALHGAGEWADLADLFSMRVLGHAQSPLIAAAGALLRTASLLFLLQFPVNVITSARPRIAWLRGLPAGILGALLTVNAVTLVQARTFDAELLNFGAFWLRYLIGMAGGLLAFLSLAANSRILFRELPKGVLVATVVFFGFNAFLSLFTAFESSIFIFFHQAVAGGSAAGDYALLAHFFRAVCAVSVAFSISYSLLLMDAEQNRDLRERQEELGRANRQLTATVEQLCAARAELVQSEKMKAIGILVGGVAHEYNNHLATIRGFAQLAAASDDLQAVRDDLRVIERTVDHTVEITRNLLSFVKPEEGESGAVDMSEAIPQVVSLVKSIFVKKGIRIVTELQAGSRAAIGQGAFQDIILNLLINSQHALEKRGGGEIRIETREAGGSVELVVRDNGCGIPAENLDKVFVPFFTTKGPLGGSQTPGTGLGLSVVYGIITGVGGSIRVESREGEGTAFTVTLPAEARRVEDAPSAAAPCLSLDGLRVLVVEDEESIRAIIRRALSGRGASVQCEENAPSALRRFADGLFDIVFLDLVMPGMHGFECLKRLKEIRPEVPVLIITGSLKELVQDEAAAGGARGVIQKPFDLAQIFEATLRALEAAPQPVRA